MSGLEIPAFVCGVVPIVVETLKSYSYIRKKLHSCRHYSEEVEETAARLASARVNFSNEVELLRRCLKGKEAGQGLDDGADSALQESYRSCLMTIDRTKKLLDKMEVEMLKFDELLLKKSQGQTIRRLRTMIKVPFNESRYDSLLARLRERNNELTTLRLQIEALRQPDTQPTGICIQCKPLPAQFCTVRLASRQLHTALRESWSCDDGEQRYHQAKLCLDADVADEVHLDLAISCQEPSCGVQTNDSVDQAQIWLYVQSSTVSTRMDSALTIGHAQTQSHNGTQEADFGSSYGRSVTLRTEASSELSSQPDRSRENTKKVELAASPDTPSVVISNLSRFLDLAADLGQTENMCNFLRTRYSTRGISTGHHCVGYLQKSGSYKHSFYFRDGVSAPDLNGSSESKIYSVEDALRQDVYVFISQVDQLRIAHKLAVAVLQYYETPWLPDHWRVLDLRYLGASDTMDATALRTLHLNSEINKPSNAARIEDFKHSKDLVSSQMRQGIPNSTLFCLGVALLEIAYWAPIETKATKQDEKNPVLTARRLQRDRSPPLGLKFQKIARQCLSCDFGFGDELSEKGLQSAVYTNVVCGLEDLITEFTGLGIN